MSHEPAASFDLGTWMWSIGEYADNAFYYHSEYNPGTVSFAFKWWDNSLDEYAKTNPPKEIDEDIWGTHEQGS